MNKYSCGFTIGDNENIYQCIQNADRYSQAYTLTMAHIGDLLTARGQSEYRILWLYDVKYKEQM